MNSKHEYHKHKEDSYQEPRRVSFIIDKWSTEKEKFHRSHPFEFSKQIFILDSPTFKPSTNSFHALLHDVKSNGWTSTHKETRVSCINEGSEGGTRLFRPNQGKNLSIITFLFFSPPLGLPNEVYLYLSQSSFLVGSWLGTVGPRALTGDKQVKPVIFARNLGVLYFFKCFNTYT